MKNILMGFFLSMTFTSFALSNESEVNKRAKEFITSNSTVLAKEIAVGHGESIDTLAELLSIQDVNVLTTFLQANYKNIDAVLNANIVEELHNVSSIDMQVTLN